MKNTKRYAALFMLLAGSCLSAQTTTVPQPLATGKSVFVGYAGSSWFPSDYGALLYQKLCDGLTHAGYNLVLTPTQSDLSFEVSAPGKENVDVHLHIVIYETRNHTLLWTIDEPLSFRIDKTAPKNFDKSIALAMSELKSLSTGSHPALSVPDETKKRLTQDKQ